MSTDPLPPNSSGLPTSPPTSSPPVAWPNDLGSSAAGSNLPRPPARPPVDTFNKRLWFAAIGGAAVVALGLILASQLATEPSVVVDAAPPITVAPDSAGSDDPATETTEGSDPTTPEDSAPDGAAPNTVLPDSSPTTSPDPDQVDAEFQAVVAEIADFVEAERGLEFQTDPVVVVLDSAEFVAQYNELLAEDVEEYATLYDNFSGIYHALGLLPPTVSLQDANAALAQGGIGGYYDPKTGELYVRGGATTPLVRAIIAHELVHALDDQWFDLDRPEYEDRDDEIGFGFRGVVEGNARFIENAYRATFTSAEQADARAEEIGLSSGLDLSMITLQYLEIQIAPYEDGVDLVGTLLANGGQPALDAAIQDPPETSEAVLFPETLGQGRIDVARPAADGTMTEDGVLGAVVVRSLLAPYVGQGAAAEAALGWGGDWFVAWEDGEQTCIRFDLVGDDQTETDQLADGFAQWAAQQPDATFELAGGLVRVTACG